METNAILPARSWKLIHIDKVIVAASIIGLLVTIWEANSGVGNLGSNMDKIWQLEMYGFRNDFVWLIKLILGGVILVKAMTKEVYVACYMVMIYAYMSGNKHIALPWIIFSAVRSLLLEAVSCFAGCLICAHYCEIKYICLDYVITKGFCLACSACLWTIVYESYVTDTMSSSETTRSLVISSPASQARSLESVLAEAVVDWFIEEADRCRKFDSKSAVDEDVARFEEGIAQRAARFLELKPEEIMEDVKHKLENKRPIIRIQHWTQTDRLGNVGECAQDDTIKTTISVGGTISEGGQTISEFDMENKNPLRRFAYFPIMRDTDSLNKDGVEFNEDIMLGNKCVSVQTLEPFEYPTPHQIDSQD